MSMPCFGEVFTEALCLSEILTRSPRLLIRCSKGRRILVYVIPFTKNKLMKNVTPLQALEKLESYMKPIKFHAVDSYTIETANYGLYIASTEVVYSWLIENKLNRRKKLLQHLQNNHSIYLESIRKGIWLPIVPIDSVSYKVYVNSEPSGPCKKVFCYTGFNLQVGSKNGRRGRGRGWKEPV